MILAGDVGGTKTLLGLFEPGTDRPVPGRIERYITTDHDGLASIVRAYFDEHPPASSIAAACFGVAGPVVGGRAQLTNVPWRVDTGEMAEVLGTPRVTLVNDLEAMAHAIPVLHEDERHTLRAGTPDRNGHAALLAAGTGMGQALLPYIDGRYHPVATEGGHRDFAARTPRELELVASLLPELGRVELETVVSGPGIARLAAFTHRASTCATCGHLSAEDEDVPAKVSAAALEGRCDACREAMQLFVSAYGSAAGDLALQTVAHGGVYLGGGIAPRILPLLTEGRFLDAFTSKGRMSALLEDIPVHVILNRRAGLLGAAVAAATLT